MIARVAPLDPQRRVSRVVLSSQTFSPRNHGEKKPMGNRRRVVWFHSWMQPENMVRAFLRGQNYEQVGKVDEAIELYETAVAAEFDSSGPYDRLIHLYAEAARHADVVRVAEAAIATVHTYEEKKSWYEQMRAEAIKAQAKVPPAAPKNPRE